MESVFSAVLVSVITVKYIAEKLDEVELTTSFLKGSVYALKVRPDQFVSEPSSQKH